MNTRWTIDVVHEALELRRQGMSYPSIAIALGHFRGLHTTGDAVRYELRRHGAAPDRRRGSTAGLHRGSSA